MKEDRRVTGISEMFDGLAVRNVCGIQNFLREEYSDSTAYEVTFSVREDDKLGITLMQCQVDDLDTENMRVSVLVYPDGRFFVYPAGREEEEMTMLSEEFPGLRMTIPAEFIY